MQFGQQYNPNQSGSRGTVQNWSNQPQSQVTPYGQQRYGPTSGSGFSSFSHLCQPTWYEPWTTATGRV